MEIALACPACGEDTEHEVLKQRAEAVTVRCLECSHVHSFSPRHARSADVGVVISEGSTSRAARMTVPADDPIPVGWEFELEGQRMLVTAIEATDGRNHDRLPARDVRTVFAKRFDTVQLKISVNEGDVTHSYHLDVSPERQIHIGEVLAVSDRKLKVKTLKSDENRTINRGFLLARSIRRAFCDEVPFWVREGKILDIRRRGKPPSADSAPRHGRKR
jgi:uncharacterized Zn finger protein